MSISSSSILAALRSEREASQRGLPLEVTETSEEDGYFLLTVRPQKGRRATIDERLEGARVKWGDELESAGRIKVVDVENDRLIVDPGRGSRPGKDETIWIFLNDFLSPLIDLWEGDDAALVRKRLKQSHDTTPLQEVRALPRQFDELRERQKLAVHAAHHRVSLLIGPPGTGKTHTIGAMAAYLLNRFKLARILVVGPTNVAVDTALLSIDDWLQRIGREDIARGCKRLGAHFDPNKFLGRDHLLAPGIAEKAKNLLMLELEEPSKSKIAEYVRWKDRIAAARADLDADVHSVSQTARVVGLTVSSAFRWRHALKKAGPWPFVICDEASQVIKPAAMMITALGQQTIFAGDPQQLSPIIQDRQESVGKMLGETAFDVFAHVSTVRLNEQSRMTHAICSAVGAVFYQGDLKVCMKAARDANWKQERSAVFVNGRQVPRVCFDSVSEPMNWSQQYGGPIRFMSAQLVKTAIDELMGSYTDPESILVLTPFRSQRSLIRQLLQRNHRAISVNTVHRAQGAERSIVIFDPVEGASPFLAGSEGARLINVAVSRAKAHVIIPFHEYDLSNPYLSRLHSISSKLWQRAGDYARPFSFASAMA